MYRRQTMTIQSTAAASSHPLSLPTYLPTYPPTAFLKVSRSLYEALQDDDDDDDDASRRCFVGRDDQWLRAVEKVLDVVQVCMLVGHVCMYVCDVCMHVYTDEWMNECMYVYGM